MAMPLLAVATTTVSQPHHLLWSSVSHIIGWGYTLIWTLSFWPQAILIWKRKSVAGVSLDFLSLNFFGFFCYTIFNLAFLLSSKVQQQYRNAHNGQENLVRWNDAAFAIHAFFMATWQFISMFLFKNAPGQHIYRWAKSFLAILVAIQVASLAVCLIGGGDDDSIIRWYDFVNICSYLKLVITLVKYAPQIVLNHRRKSTRGFAILGITLDFSGGLLSLLQLFIDAQLINHDWTGARGDIGKLGLSFISIFFDVILLVQHYILFGDAVVADEVESEVESDERQPLLQ